MIDFFKFMRKDDGALLKAIKEENDFKEAMKKNPPSPTYNEIIKKKKLIMSIIYYDGTEYKSWHTLDADTKYTPITVNFNFYKWYFHRPQSKMYNLCYSGINGTSNRIIKRKDIKIVEFKTEIIEEKMEIKK